MERSEPRYHVVLVRPDIAGNTGNVGRSCMALSCRLHLVHPLGYRITDANLKRAGMDYWPLLDLKEHDDTDSWMASLPEAAPVFLLTTKATQAWSPAEVPAGAILVFGSESAGLPAEVHARWQATARRIPMDARARSLNLSSSVALVLGSLLLK
jgi:tRNA (cytidine/uridine-2'-O-)-methyltransferase